MAILVLLPTGAGYFTQLTSSSKTKENWECVAEKDMENVWPCPAEEPILDTYQMQNHTTETGVIDKVIILYKARKTIGKGARAASILRTHVVHYVGKTRYDQGGVVTDTSLIYFYQNYSDTYDVNPWSGKAWTWTEIDDLQAGIILENATDGGEGCTWQTGAGYGSPKVKYLTVWVFYTEKGTSDRDVSVDIDKTDLSNRSVSVEVTHPITIIMPTGVGNSSNLGFAGDTPAWECVDDPNIPPSNDNSDYVFESSGTAYDTYQMANHTTEIESISNVRVYVRAKKITSGSEVGRTVLRSGGTDYFGSTTLGFVWQYHYTDYALNPADSEAWEWSDIDALEAGVELTWISGSGPRCTQVYVEVTRAISGKSDINVSVDIEEFSSMSDRDISVDVEQWNTPSDRNVAVKVFNPIYLELCKYDTSNSRWSDGSPSGTRKRFIKHITPIKRKESLEGLSTITFDLLTDDSDLQFDEGDVIALGTDFTWDGVIGNSTSSFQEILFEGIVTKVNRSYYLEGTTDITRTKIQATHIVYDLANQYEQRLISIRKVYHSGKIKECTPAWHIKNLLEDVTYYDRTGSEVTMPMRIRSCDRFIKHREYVDKNKLQILLDLCDLSSNIFYCHNDAFYFESKRPILDSTRFDTDTFSQDFRSLEWNLPIKINIDVGTLTDNGWDVIGDTWVSWVWHAWPYRNTSEYTQNLDGFAFYPLGYTGLTNIYISLTEVVSKENLTSYNNLGAGMIDWTLSGWQRFRQNVPDESIPSLENRVLYFATEGADTGDDFSFGGQTPPLQNAPIMYFIWDGVSQGHWVYRTNRSPTYYKIMADQIRFVSPIFPARMRVQTPSGDQIDQYIMEGYSPTLDESVGITGIGHVSAETKAGDLTMLDQSSSRVFLFNRNFTYLSDFDSGGDNTAPNLTGNIDDDEDLIGWENDIEKLYVEIGLSDDLDASDQRVGIVWNLDHSGNGFDDYTVAECYYSSGTKIDFYNVTNNSKGSVTTKNITSMGYHYAFKFLLDFKDEDGVIVNTWGKKSSDDTWVEQTEAEWDSETLSTNGLGIFVKDLHDDWGIKYWYSWVDTEYASELEIQHMSKLKVTEEPAVAQYIIVGEKGSESANLPIGKYPATPDAVGEIKIITKKLPTNAICESYARQLYDTDQTFMAKFGYHAHYFDTGHQDLKPNKQINFSSSIGNLYITDIQTVFVDFGVTSKVTAGRLEKNIFTTIIEEQEKEEEAAQSKVSAPIFTKHDIIETESEGIIDEPLTIESDHYFIKEDI